MKIAKLIILSVVITAFCGQHCFAKSFAVFNPAPAKIKNRGLNGIPKDYNKIAADYVFRGKDPYVQAKIRKKRIVKNTQYSRRR